MWTAAFERYVEPARERAQIWRLILGVIVGGLILIAFTFGLMGAIIGLLGLEDAQDFLARSQSPDTPQGFLFMFSSFIGLALAPIAVVRWIHRRTVGSLFGPRAVLTRDFLRAGAVVVAIYAVMITLWSLAFDMTPNLDTGTWLRFLPFAIIGILIQTLSEELVFRAYLVQQMAARFRSPLIWFGLPALAFGAVHYSPGTAGANAIYLVFATGFFAIVATDLTRRTGSIGAAWGMHFVNNLFAILLLSTDGHLTGLSLYVTPYTADDALLPTLLLGDAFTLVLTWFILIRILPR